MSFQSIQAFESRKYLSITHNTRRGEEPSSGELVECFVGKKIWKLARKDFEEQFLAALNLYLLSFLAIFKVAKKWISVLSTYINN